MKILVSAYACEPDKGSEAAVGWNWAKLISGRHETWVITRKNNRAAIERELAREPNPRLHFEYVDLPEWLSFWKRGPKRVRTYYYLWQFAALGRALGLDRKIKFDCGHHVTFVNNWLWTFFALTSIPFVWGPIGSNAPVPKAYLEGRGEWLRDRMGALLRSAFRLGDPLYWLTCLRAHTVLAINPQSRDVVPLKWVKRGNVVVEPAIGIEEIKPMNGRQNGDSFSVLFAGRIIAIKQPGLALDAFAEFAQGVSGARLTLLGSGPLEQCVRDRARQLKIFDQVRFISWLPREEALDMMRKCDVLLFPSMEGAGMVVLEAMAAGKPVVALDYGGPGMFVDGASGIKVPLTSRAQSARDLADALRTLSSQPDLKRTMGEGARRRIKDFSWERKAEVMEKIYSGMERGRRERGTR